MQFVKMIFYVREKDYPSVRDYSSRIENLKKRMYFADGKILDLFLPYTREKSIHFEIETEGYVFSYCRGKKHYVFSLPNPIVKEEIIKKRIKTTIKNGKKHTITKVRKRIYYKLNSRYIHIIYDDNKDELAELPSFVFCMPQPDIIYIHRPGKKPERKFVKIQRLGRIKIYLVVLDYNVREGKKFIDRVKIADLEIQHLRHGKPLPGIRRVYVQLKKKKRELKKEKEELEEIKELLDKEEDKNFIKIIKHRIREIEKEIEELEEKIKQLQNLDQPRAGIQLLIKGKWLGREINHYIWAFHGSNDVERGIEFGNQWMKICRIKKLPGFIKEKIDKKPDFICTKKFQFYGDFGKLNHELKLSSIPKKHIYYDKSGKPIKMEIKKKSVRLKIWVFDRIENNKIYRYWIFKPVRRSCRFILKNKNHRWEGWDRIFIQLHKDYVFVFKHFINKI